MKKPFYTKGMMLAIALFSCLFFSTISQAQTGSSRGIVAAKVNELKQKGAFGESIPLGKIAYTADRIAERDAAKMLKQFTLLDMLSTASILSSKPSFLNVTVPIDNGRGNLHLLLFQQDISPNGFTQLSSSGTSKHDKGNIIHYRGSIDGDLNSVAAISISENEIAGMISNNIGNYVLGKLSDQSGKHIIYNDKDVIETPVFNCGTNTNIPQSAGTYFKGSESTSSLTTKCVNWYWETDLDIFNNKGSEANVNTFIQGIFNQVSTLYANDGISITLKTLFIWTTTDPYIGPTTGNYLDQFGVNRTSFDGDMATLIGFQGGGGVAWVNTLCNSLTKYRMAYAGISSGFNTVPSYSWTVEVITHEQGHNLGSRHTHDCAWNGNNTKIDGCGDAAGYPSGSCPVPSPALPVGGGTIMSYCHLTSAGINFNLGFGPQPTALIINNINNATCLTNCTGGCSTPAQPGTITGNASVCSTSSQTYSVAAVPGATGYAWTLPSGWTGTSTTNSITVTAGSTSGNVSVAASNTCGNGTARTLAVTALVIPAQPGTISGNAAVCPATTQTYSVTAVNGATSYTWTLPSGWAGSSTTNSINTTSGTAGGNITVRANGSCGSGTIRSLAVGITASSPAQPGTISGSATVCPGAVQTFSVTAVAGASSYTWTVPAGWGGSSTTNSISVSAGTTAGNITVKANNGCGSSTARSLAVSPGTLPATPGVITITGGAATVCTGDNRTYTVPLVSGLTYTWVAPTGATITTGQGTNSITINFTASFTSPGTLSVSARNSCGNGSARTLSISKATLARPAAIVVSGGIAKVCPGDSRTYSTTAVAGMTYNWVVPAGATITSGQGSSSITVSYTPNFVANGTMSVTANNACGTSTARTLTIARNVLGSPAAITGAAGICPGSTSIYTASAVAGATSYNWTLPTGATIIGSATGNSITIQWGTRGGNLSVRAVNACGNSGSRSLAITVNCTAGFTSAGNTNTSVEIYPNPVSDIAKLRFTSTGSTNYTIAVSDMAGRKLISEVYRSVPGLNIHQLNLSRLSKGSYLVTIENGLHKQVQKINVQ